MTTTPHSSVPRARIRDRGQVDALVLAALADGPLRYDEVADVLRDRVGGTLDVPYSRVVPTLHRLARNRLVARRADGFRRFRLTDTGRRSLTARLRAADAFADAAHQLADGS